MPAMGWITEMLRKWYENRVSVKYGYLKLLGNVAMLQMSPGEYLDITSPNKRIVTDIRVSVTGVRPMLIYRYWPKGAAWETDFPVTKVILEEKRISVCNENDVWFVAGEDDERVAALRDMFLSFAFYQPLRAEHKKKKVDAETEKKILEQLN